MAQSRAILVPVEDKEEQKETAEELCNASSRLSRTLCAFQEALQALDWTLQQFYRPGDVFYLLHVVLTSKPFGSGLFPGSEPNSPLSSADHSEALEMEQAKTWITDRFVTAVESSKATCKVVLLKAASSLSVGDIICQKAEELSAVLLVMTAEKRGGVACFYEGSVVQHCIQNCNCSVLAWRPE